MFPFRFLCLFIPMAKFFLFLRTLMVCLLVSSLTVFGQEFMNKDSLLRLLPTAPEDPSKVELLIHIGQQFEANEPEKAKMYYRWAGDVSKKIDYPLGEVKFIANYTFILNMQGLTDSSLFYNLRSVEICRQIKDSGYLAKTLFNTGTSYRVMGKLEKALEYYLEGQKLFGLINAPANQAVVLDLLNVLYCDLHQYQKALQYGQLSVKKSRSLGITDGRLGLQLSNLGNTYSFLGQYTQAKRYYLEALQIGEKVNDQNILGSNLPNLGDVYLHSGEYDKLKDVYERALVINKKLESNEGIIVSLKGLAIYYQLKGSLDKAKEFASQAQQVSVTTNMDVQRAQVLKLLSNIHFSMRDIPAGYSYAWQHEALQDSILNKSIREKTAEMEKVFEVEQKDNKISALEKEKRLQLLNIEQKNNINSLLIAVVAALILIGLLVYRNYMHKQSLQKQRIVELETEKKLAATEALLQGQEQERYRLAKDLHDGLGGMLSGISYSFSNVKENLVLSHENQLVFERGLDMLNSSIQEMRRVAHNLMPESLLHFGIDAALRDYCKKMNDTGMIRVSYQSLGLQKESLDQTTALVVYRVIQELLNNAIKHAHAKDVIVQLSLNERKLSITVEDDGIAFDTSTLDTAKGIGWNNIRSRVKFLNGRVDLDSQPGKGTSIFIEVDV